MRLDRSPALTVLTLCLVAAAGPAAAAAPGRADFSGAWKLNEAESTRIADLLGKDETVQDGAAGAGGESAGRRGGGRGGGGLGDSVYELLEEVKGLVVADDGETVRITRALGKKRTIFTDGEERELDDGEGPAKVTARRKGAQGERIAVSSKWPTGRSASETWEILQTPRRLVVTTKMSGRQSFTVKRVYDPVPAGSLDAMLKPAPAPGPAVPAGAEASDTASSGPAAAATAAPRAEPPAGLAKCSVRPPRGASGAELARLAKVSQSAAQRRALDFVAPRKPVSVITSEAEVYEGCLVWTFVLRFSDRKGVQEIAVDAGDGKLLASEVDAGGTEAAEKP